MGIEHSPYTYVGVYTDCVGTWLVEQGKLKNYDEYVDEYDEDYDFAIQEIYGLDATCVNLLTGEGFYIGFEAYDWREYQNLLNRFKEITGVEGDVHDFVKVH
jgi:hypothetical protein